MTKVWDDVTVCTSSIPGRYTYLTEAIACVENQTLRPHEHLILIDPPRRLLTTGHNRLAGMVETEWMLFLDDDDLLDANHLETLFANLRPDDEVLYTYCRSKGHHQFENYNQPFDADRLQQRSIVAQNAMFRTRLFHEVGGCQWDKYCDWLLWREMSRAGVKFRAIPEVTWTYRFHDTNDSWGRLDRSKPELVTV